MVYLNYNNLDNETQERLLSMSKAEVESRCGKYLKTYAELHHLDYDILLEDETIKNLYSYMFVFNI